MLHLAEPEIKFSIDAVKEASKLAKQVQSEMTAGELTKGDRSPVTVADFAVQAVVAKRLHASFPKDVLVAEEDAHVLREEASSGVLKQVMSFVNRFIKDASAEQVLDWIDIGNGKPGKRFWTLDPIDGTKGFLRGDQYAVGLSLIEDGQVRFAAIACPNLDMEAKADMCGYGSLTIAVQGQGTWKSSLRDGDEEFQRVSVSDIIDPKEARILRSVEAAHTNTSRTKRFLELLGSEAEPILMDSFAKHVSLASGRGEAFFYLLPKSNPHYRMKIWDVAPGYLVIKEAGGNMTDLEGNDIDFTQGISVARNPGLLMTNGHLHSLVLRLLSEASA